ncbi:MAG: 30S ribosomal protein S16 [Candidatus Veblenbacteria bacterium]|nr:30S ribosomal protein S16 [Candidatus Veblenbacteria bacterium]
MLMIRLARTGKTKQAHFRLIVSEKTKDTHGDYLEILGHLNPHNKERQLVLKADRVEYWLAHGAQPSPTVHNLLVDQGIVKADKLRVWKPKKKAAEPAAPQATASKPKVEPAEAKAVAEPQPVESPAATNAETEPATEAPAS